MIAELLRFVKGKVSVFEEALYLFVGVAFGILFRSSPELADIGDMEILISCVIWICVLIAVFVVLERISLYYHNRKYPVRQTWDNPKRIYVNIVNILDVDLRDFTSSSGDGYVTVEVSDCQIEDLNYLKINK